jgi:hypothetical protein
VSSQVTVDAEASEITIDTDGESYGAYLLWMPGLAYDVDRYRARIGEVDLLASA